jgi:Zn-dependent protease
LKFLNLQYSDFITKASLHRQLIDKALMAAGYPRKRHLAEKENQLVLAKMLTEQVFQFAGFKGRSGQEKTGLWNVARFLNSLLRQINLGNITVEIGLENPHSLGLYQPDMLAQDEIIHHMIELAQIARYRSALGIILGTFAAKLSLGFSRHFMWGKYSLWRKFKSEGPAAVMKKYPEIYGQIIHIYEMRKNTVPFVTVKTADGRILYRGMVIVLEMPYSERRIEHRTAGDFDVMFMIHDRLWDINKTAAHWVVDFVGEIGAILRDSLSPVGLEISALRIREIEARESLPKHLRKTRKLDQERKRIEQEIKKSREEQRKLKKQLPKLQKKYPEKIDSILERIARLSDTRKEFSNQIKIIREVMAMLKQIEKEIKTLENNRRQNKTEQELRAGLAIAVQNIFSDRLDKGLALAFDSSEEQNRAIKENMENRKRQLEANLSVAGLTEKEKVLLKKKLDKVKAWLAASEIQRVAAFRESKDKELIELQFYTGFKHYLDREQMVRQAYPSYRQHLTELVGSVMVGGLLHGLGEEEALRRLGELFASPIAGPAFVAAEGVRKNVKAFLTLGRKAFYWRLLNIALNWEALNKGSKVVAKADDILPPPAGPTGPTDAPPADDGRGPSDILPVDDGRDSTGLDAGMPATDSRDESAPRAEPSSTPVSDDSTSTEAETTEVSATADETSPVVEPKEPEAKVKAAAEEIVTIPVILRAKDDSKEVRGELIGESDKAYIVRYAWKTLEGSEMVERTFSKEYYEIIRVSSSTVPASSKDKEFSYVNLKIRASSTTEQRASVLSLTPGTRLMAVVQDISSFSGFSIDTTPILGPPAKVSKNKVASSASSTAPAATASARPVSTLTLANIALGILGISAGILGVSLGIGLIIKAFGLSWTLSLIYSLSGLALILAGIELIMISLRDQLNLITYRATSYTYSFLSLVKREQPKLFALTVIVLLAAIVLSVAQGFGFTYLDGSTGYIYLAVAALFVIASLTALSVMAWKADRFLTIDISLAVAGIITMALGLWILGAGIVSLAGILSAVRLFKDNLIVSAITSGISVLVAGLIIFPQHTFGLAFIAAAPVLGAIFYQGLHRLMAGKLFLGIVSAFTVIAVTLRGLAIITKVAGLGILSNYLLLATVLVLAVYMIGYGLWRFFEPSVISSGHVLRGSWNLLKAHWVFTVSSVAAFILFYVLKTSGISLLVLSINYIVLLVAASLVNSLLINKFLTEKLTNILAKIEGGIFSVAYLSWLLGWSAYVSQFTLHIPFAFVVLAIMAIILVAGYWILPFAAEMVTRTRGWLISLRDITLAFVIYSVKLAAELGVSMLIGSLLINLTAWQFGIAFGISALSAIISNRIFHKNISGTLIREISIATTIFILSIGNMYGVSLYAASRIGGIGVIVATALVSVILGYRLLAGTLKWLDSVKQAFFSLFSWSARQVNLYKFKALFVAALITLIIVYPILSGASRLYLSIAVIAVIAANNAIYALISRTVPSKWVAIVTAIDTIFISVVALTFLTVPAGLVWWASALLAFTAINTIAIVSYWSLRLPPVVSNWWPTVREKVFRFLKYGVVPVVAFAILLISLFRAFWISVYALGLIGVIAAIIIAIRYGIAPFIVRAWNVTGWHTERYLEGSGKRISSLRELFSGYFGRIIFTTVAILAVGTVLALTLNKILSIGLSFGILAGLIAAILTIVILAKTTLWLVSHYQFNLAINITLLLNAIDWLKTSTQRISGVVTLILMIEGLLIGAAFLTGSVALYVISAGVILLAGIILASFSLEGLALRFMGMSTVKRTTVVISGIGLIAFGFYVSIAVNPLFGIYVAAGLVVVTILFTFGIKGVNQYRSRGPKTTTRGTPTTGSTSSSAASDFEEMHRLSFEIKGKKAAMPILEGTEITIILPDNERIEFDFSSYLNKGSKKVLLKYKGFTKELSSNNPSIKVGKADKPQDIREEAYLQIFDSKNKTSRKHVTVALWKESILVEDYSTNGTKIVWGTPESGLIVEKQGKWFIRTEVNNPGKTMNENLTYSWHNSKEEALKAVKEYLKAESLNEDTVSYVDVVNALSRENLRRGMKVGIRRIGEKDAFTRGEFRGASDMFYLVVVNGEGKVYNSGVYELVRDQQDKASSPSVNQAASKIPGKELAEKLIKRIETEVIKPLNKELGRLWGAERGTYEFYHGAEISKKAQDAASRALNSIIEQEVKSKETPVLLEAGKQVKKFSAKLQDEYFIDAARKVLLSMGHTLAERSALNVNTKIFRFMHQRVAARTAKRAATVLVKRGLEKIKLGKVYRAKGEFKDGSDNRIYLLETNLAFGSKGKLVEHNGYGPALSFFVITDNKNRIKTVAVEWQRKPVEDYSSKFYVLQGRYRGTRISDAAKEQIRALRRKVKNDLKKWFRENKPVSEEQYYIMGPMVEQGALESDLDRSLKAFISNNAIAQHLLSLPEYQFLDQISFSAGIYTVESEKFALHDYGRNYSLPAGYFVFQRGILRSVLNRPLYLDARILAIHEMLHHITRARYMGLYEGRFKAEREKALKHFEQLHPDAWRQWIKLRDNDFEEYLNTLMGFVAIGNNDVEFTIPSPNKRNPKMGISHKINNQDLQLFQELGLMPQSKAKTIASSVVNGTAALSAIGVGLISSYSLWIVAIFLVSLTVHEFAHAWVAHLYGDDTAKKAGRLTLNPLKHISILGTIVMPLLVGFGWAKPVPVNYETLKQKKGVFVTAFAGPLANIILALALSAAFRMFALQASAFTGIFIMAIGFNLLLAALNLIPLWPLDGYRMLESKMQSANARSIDDDKLTISRFVMLAALIGFLTLGGVGLLVIPVKLLVYKLLGLSIPIVYLGTDDNRNVSSSNVIDLSKYGMTEAERTSMEREARARGAIYEAAKPAIKTWNDRGNTPKLGENSTLSITDYDIELVDGILARNGKFSVEIISTQERFRKNEWLPNLCCGKELVVIIKIKEVKLQASAAGSTASASSTLRQALSRLTLTRFTLVLTGAGLFVSGIYGFLALPLQVILNANVSVVFVAATIVFNFLYLATGILCPSCRQRKYLAC